MIKLIKYNKYIYVFVSFKCILWIHLIFNLIFLWFSHLVVYNVNMDNKYRLYKWKLNYWNNKYITQV